MDEKEYNPETLGETTGVTIGDEINRLATEYIELYHKLREDDNEWIRQNAHWLAPQDLFVKKYIYKQAHARVKAEIANWHLPAEAVSKLVANQEAIDEGPALKELDDEFDFPTHGIDDELDELVEEESNDG